ncbi:LysR family transcriptional regulator [Sphingomonas sp.]|jgi:DNA-binding transcriptional LysR family regulator|uniref:LysR family transcriptional regulator n=1 Tax=Sphingomonas sp. TaxID=28214 RepID=UPI002610C6EB|nr:LysR family transcriptional regulator [Sphingomonas sp.]
MIERYHLRYFLAVVTNGNFSRAAAACNVSQPTLSVGIAKLEKLLGSPLFSRTNRRVALTDAGAKLLLHARTIEASFAAAERDVAGSSVPQTLRLGVLTTIARRWIEELLRDETLFLDGGRIEIVEGSERELRGRLARGRIDAALTILRDGDAGGTAQRLHTENYMLALGRDHRLAARRSVRAEDLSKDAMILRRHCELLPETSRFFTAHGIRPFFAARTTSEAKAISYVRAGLGVTIMPRTLAEEGVVMVPLDGFDFTRDVALIWAPHVQAERGPRSPVAAAMVRIASAEAERDSLPQPF